MIKEVEAKTILTKHKRIDSWFLSAYGMNLYRGCTHNCAYCDGRNEKYRVEGEFGSDIHVKMNAVELLEKELDPRRKRTPFKNGYIMVGGGVGDSYQPLEKEIGLTRRVLELMSNYPFPVHILTKNSLIERDLDIINTIHQSSGSIVSMSFSTVDDVLARRFEPGSSLPSERLCAMKKFKEQGIPIGMFLMPVIPFLSDTKEMIQNSLRAARDIDVDFVMFGTMTLKQGRQKDHYVKVIQKYYPGLWDSYDRIYSDNRWGNSSPVYIQGIEKVFAKTAKQQKIPRRIPSFLYNDVLTENEKIVVMLEHLDYCLKQDQRKSPYGYAAYEISKLNQPLSNIGDLQSIKGVGQVTEKIIRDILKTGSSSYLESVI